MNRIVSKFIEKVAPPNVVPLPHNDDPVQFKADLLQKIREIEAAIAVVAQAVAAAPVRNGDEADAGVFDAEFDQIAEEMARLEEELGSFDGDSFETGLGSIEGDPFDGDPFASE